VAAGLAGCGDDVTIVDPPPPPPPPPAQIQSVSVTPDVVNLQQTATPQNVQFAAAVTADAGIGALTYAWTTTDATKATVTSGAATANATVTVVANATGTVGVRVNVSAANGATGSGTAQIIVGAGTPANIQLQSVTFTNTFGNEVPVVLTNVFGQIQIHLNVDPGTRNVSRVEALIGPVGQEVVVNSQGFSSAVAEAAAQAGPEEAPTTIVLSVNTMQVRKNGTTFVPVIFNGNSNIVARLVFADQTQPLASNSVPVVMNNGDAEIQPATSGVGKFSPTAGAGTSVTGPTTAAGSTWYGNVATVDIETHFLAFQKTLPSAHTLSSVGCGAIAATIAGTPTAGIVVSGKLPCTTASGVVTPSVVPAATSYAPATSGPDGTGLVAPAAWSTVGSAFTVGGESRWNLITPSLTILAALNVDNVAPAVNIAGDGSFVVPGSVAFNDNFDQFWISNTYPFTVYNAISNPLGDMLATDAGVGLAAGSPKARHFTGSIPACDATNLPTQTGADFAETLTSGPPGTDFEQACAWAADGLGNAATSGGSNPFGVDYAKATAPLVRLAGSTAATPSIAPSTPSSVLTVANTTIFGNGGLGSPIGTTNPAGESFFTFPATDVWGLEAIDDRSGFDLAGLVAGMPANQAQSRLAQIAPTACGLFGNLLPQPLSDVYVRTNPTLVALDCAQGIGYYTYTGRVTDRAGNTSVTITRNFVRDDVAAPTVAGFSATNLPYTPGAAGSFAFFAQDDLEVIQGTILLNVPVISGGVGLRYPLGAVAGLGARWDNVLTGLITNGVATISYMFFRVDETCSAAATPYASCPAAGPQPYVTAPRTAAPAEYDFVAGTDAGQLPTSAAGAVADAADQLSGSVATPGFLPAFFNPQGIAEPWTAAGTQLQSWDLDVVTVAGSGLARQVGTTSVTTPFFEGADLYRFDNVNGEYVRCGPFPAPVPNDNGPDRVWTATLALPTTAGPCANGPNFAAVSWRALGRKGGAGLFTPTR
jgi:hypothetical protein